MNRRSPLLAAAALALAACSGKAPSVPDAPTGFTSAAPVIGEMALVAPAYGVVTASSGGPELEVNVEASDARRVRAGLAATALVGEDGREVSGRVSRVLRGASAETGQALAWITPERRGDLSAAVGEFVSASIVIGTRRRALLLPRSAVFVRDGRTFVVVSSTAAGGPRWQPREVETGAESGGRVEIARGLSPGDTVAVQGGLGYLYPDFKAAAGD